jgi:neutral trehalase
VFEESYFDDSAELQTAAPTNVNVAVAVGAYYTADLARCIGDEVNERKYRIVFETMAHAINTYLWDERDGVYYNYDLRQHKSRKGWAVSTFDPLRLGIAPAPRRERLLRRLIDPGEFNWGRYPLTTRSMKDPDFGDDKYLLGSVWTEFNILVVKGLKESGRPDLAAELGWQTINAFSRGYNEYRVFRQSSG